MKANSKRKVFGDAVDLLMGDMEEVTMPRTNLKTHMKDLRMRLSLVRLLITEPHSKR